MIRFLRALALAMTLIVAVPASGIGQVLFYCTMTGKIGPHCCCEPGKQHKNHAAMKHDSEHSQPAVANLPKHTAKKASCCEVLKNSRDYNQNALEGFAPSIQSLAILTPLPFAFPNDDRVLPSRHVVPVGLRGPPPDLRHPIYKRNCSYLN